MVSLSADLLRMVDGRIRSAAQRVTAVGTVTEVAGSVVYVAFDGSSMPLPVKYLAGLNLAPDIRVTLTLFGADWVVTGSFLRSPPTTTPTLLNGWSNFGNPYAPVAYYKDSAGVVHLEGMITGGTVTNGTNLLQLDAGYRPAATLPFTVVTSGGQARIDVASDGNVKAITGVSNAFLSLAGVNFLARQ